MTQKKKFSRCTSTEFITDISELCDKCPLTDEIESSIKDKVIPKAVEQKEILSDEGFREYINKEIELAQKGMQDSERLENLVRDQKKEPHRANRIFVYIFCKEKIKALNKILINGVQLHGFKSRLSMANVNDVCEYMNEHGYIVADRNDFISVFSNEPANIQKPIIWCVKNKRGISTGQGNKTALYVFLEFMLGKGNVSRKDLRKLKFFFRDELGNPMEINNAPNPDKISVYGFQNYLTF